jgi:hypothetical protein
VTLALQGDGDSVAERLGRAYLIQGISGWTFVDTKGDPVPCTRENISRLRWSEAVYRLADKASDLYASVLDPLVVRASASSPGGRTAKRTRRTSPG